MSIKEFHPDLLQEEICSISSLIGVMEGYCENHRDNKQIFPLLSIIALVKVEITKITDMF